MTLVRRRAAVLFAGACAVAGALALGGCTPPRHEEPAPQPPVATADAVDALRARYAAAGNLVGRVTAITADPASQTYVAAVAGIEATAAGNEQAVFTFVDPATDTYVNNGTLAQKGALGTGDIVVSFDPQGQRTPQTGDLVVRRK